MDNSGITILNVDGNEVGLFAKSRVLREAGYRVVEARTGAEALLLALRESPQVVLLSVDLPDQSGLETLGRIKAEAALSSRMAPPLVLLMSATFVGCEKRARALEDGADGYLLEPATPEFLLANIKMLLRRSETARPLADERQVWAMKSLTRFALAINSADSLDEVLRIAAREARELIGAHQAVVSLNSDAFDPGDPAAGKDQPEAATAVSLSERYAQEPVAVNGRRCETWLSALVCRLNQPMRLTQAELESQFGLRNRRGEPLGLAVLNGVITPREAATLREMACLREIAGLREVATLRELASLREVAAMRNPQMLRGLDMRGWLAAPLTSRNGYNLGLIQLSDRYDGEFLAGDEAVLAQLAQMISIAIECRWRWRQERKLREAAEKTARAKDEFMAATSYRLRAQLNTMLGWSWVLRRQPENMEDVTRAAEIIERAARTQAQLVEDLMGAPRFASASWSDGEMEGRMNGEAEGWREEEGERWKDGETEGSRTLSIPPPLHFSVSTSLSSSGDCSPGAAPRGMAAGGGS